MIAVDSVRIPIGSSPETDWLEITVIPQHRNSIPSSLIDAREETSSSGSSSVQLLEGAEYRFQFHVRESGLLTTSHPEVFEADDNSGRSGRVKPGLSVGEIQVAVHIDGFALGPVSVEVRSRKLNYRSEYQWMLRDIAEAAAEVVMERFASSERSFAVDDGSDSRTAYQRFTFLKALLQNETFQAALTRITQRPHIEWELESEDRPIRRGVSASSRLAREVTRLRAGGRTLNHQGTTLPDRIRVNRSRETVDNIPNRFVAFALRRWIAEVESIRGILKTGRRTPQAERGLRETADVQRQLEEVLAHSVFADTSELNQLPTNNTVLLSRSGYRDVYRAFLEFEMAARLSWDGGDAVYGAGQKDVATLYEYWVFIQLAKVLADLSNGTFNLSDLLREDRNQLSLSLVRGEARCLRGTIQQGQRSLTIQLWFNKTFSGGDREGSWSQELRPDCSLLISPSDSFAGWSAPIWLHFDAKYRIELGMWRAQPGGDGTAPDAEGRRSSRRDDLLKMHAYRDAIRRSAGAYVIYPGDRAEEFRQFHELLPGLGAFALRPTESGDASGVAGLRTFLSDVLRHVSSQTTQHERGRYWFGRIFERPQVNRSRVVADFLGLPPADTRVLLGFARTDAHVDWIACNRLYNIRADTRRGSLGLESPELGSELVVIYARTLAQSRLFRVDGAPLVLDAEQLATSGYPSPRGRIYLCLPLSPLSVSAADLSWGTISALVRSLSAGRPLGAPIATTWSRVLHAASHV